MSCASACSDAARRWGAPVESIAWHQGVMQADLGDGLPGGLPRREGVSRASARAVMEAPVTDAEWQAAQAFLVSVSPAPQAASSRQVALGSALRSGGHFIHDLVLPGLLHGSVLHRVAGATFAASPESA